MAKDSVEYKGEVYGRIWEAITWDKEEKEYQHLTNALFMAAKEDIIEEKKETGRYTKKKIFPRSYDNFYNDYITIHELDPSLKDSDDHVHVKALDKFIQQLLPNNDERSISQKQVLKDRLLPDYSELKNNLNDVRVLGIGNTNVEAIGKACKACLKAMVVTTILPVVSAVGLVIGSLLSPIGGLVVGGAMGAALGVATNKSIEKSVELTKNRHELKEDLKSQYFVKSLVKERSEANNKQHRKH